MQAPEISIPSAAAPAINIASVGVQFEVMFSAVVASASTFSASVVAPEKINPTIIEGEIATLSLSIDLNSSLMFNAQSSRGPQVFTDDFSDFSQTSNYSGVQIQDSAVELTGSVGFVESIEISGAVDWGEFSFNDNEPSNTDIKYQVFYFEEEQWSLVPSLSPSFFSCNCCSKAPLGLHDSRSTGA